MTDLPPPGYLEHDLDMCIQCIEEAAQIDPDSVDLDELRQAHLRLSELISDVVNGAVGRAA